MNDIQYWVTAFSIGSIFLAFIVILAKLGSMIIISYPAASIYIFVVGFMIFMSTLIGNMIMITLRK